MARRFRQPPDPAISALDAGRAYYTLTQVGRQSEVLTFEHPVPRQIRGPWIPDREGNPFGKELRAVFETIMTRAVRGFTPQEVRYLESVASHPGLPEASIVARASQVDYLGARFTPQYSVAAWMLPSAFFVHPDVVYPFMARTALHVFHRRQVDAEASLRELMSLGLTVMDEGHSWLELLIGHRLVETGLKGLEDLYAATGRLTEAQNLDPSGIRPQ